MSKEAKMFPYFEEGHPILKIVNGVIRGHVLKTENNTHFYAFQEIPYAAPPIGELRFKPPVPAQNWHGILNTTKNTKVPYQKKPPNDDQTPDPRENEDCLYLNVFTPHLPTQEDSDLLPVMFYIYGGMMQSGEPTEYNFDLFLEQDIVVVTVNFRSGALGFLSTEDGVIRGNNGLKDQNMALRWLQRNIQFFGGDPSKVTLVGHSSGAMCVGLHVLSEKSKGLFRAAILQSATPFANIALQKDLRYNAFALGRALCPNFSLNSSSAELLDLLMTMPAEKIMRADIDVPPHLRNTWEHCAFVSWSMSLEDPNDEESFLSGPLHDRVKDGDMAKVPILIGTTDEECIGNVFTSEKAAYFDNNITALINENLRIREENRIAFATELKDIYTKVPFQQNLTGIYRFFADVIFTIPCIRHAELHSQYADTYFYQFSYKGPLNGLLEKRERPPGLGNNGHCAELPFLYKYRWNPDVVPSESDQVTRKRLTKLWGNFIKHLNPTPKPEPLLENVIWPQVSANEFEYLDIGSELLIKRDPSVYKAWKQRLEKYFEHPMITY